MRTARSCLNKLEGAINAASEPLAFRSKGAARWDFVRAADDEDTWCEVKEGGRIKTAFRTYFHCGSGSDGVLRHGHLQQALAPQAQ